MVNMTYFSKSSPLLKNSSNCNNVKYLALVWFDLTNLGLKIQTFHCSLNIVGKLNKNVAIEVFNSKNEINETFSVIFNPGESSVRPNQEFYRTTEPNRTMKKNTEPNRTVPNRRPNQYWTKKLTLLKNVIFSACFLVCEIILVVKSTRHVIVSFKSNILKNSNFL